MHVPTNISRVVAVGALAFIASCGPAEVTREPVRKPHVEVLSSDAIDIRGKTGVYINGDAGKKAEISFSLPIDRLNVGYFHDVERVGYNGNLVAILDTYGSRTNGSRCTDGRESWLRIFSLVSRREIESVPVESCLDGLQPGQPPVIWREDGFEIGGSRPRHFAIDGERILALKAKKT